MLYKILDLDQNSEQWYVEHLGKITSSRLSKLVNDKLALKEDILRAIKAQGNELTGKETIQKLLPMLSEESRYELFKAGEKKKEFWRLVSERLFTIPEEYEDPRDGGHRKEPDAIARFEKETGIKTSKVGMIISTENENMGVSPDAVIFTKKNIITEAVEAKSFENAHHAEAVITQKLPKDLWPQMIQYFIVIDTLEKLHVVFYSENTPYPRLQYFEITITRKEVEDQIANYRQQEVDILRYVDEIVSEYAF